jgi:hypothetical protein
VFSASFFDSLRSSALCGAAGNAVAAAAFGGGGEGATLSVLVIAFFDDESLIEWTCPPPRMFRPDEELKVVAELGCEW